MAENSDRQRSLLTPKQRNFLKGETDIDPDSSHGRTFRTRLRERIRHGLSDFEYLADPERLNERDLQQIREIEMSMYRKGSFSTEDVFNPLLEDALVEMVAFIHRVQPDEEAFNRIVKKGKSRAQRRLFGPDDIADAVREKYDQGEPWNDDELRFAINNPDRVELSDVEILDHARQQEDLGERLRREAEEWAGEFTDQSDE